MNGKAEWIELRLRTRLTAAKLDAILGELGKDGKISIISRETHASTHDVILLKPG